MREKWDLFNAQRQPLHQTMFRGDVVPSGTYRTIVHILMFNDQRQCLIQQRQSTKSSWANMWDFTAGGSVIAGETSQQGAMRELHEEVGIAYDFEHCLPILTTPFSEGFDDVYAGYYNGDVTQLALQPAEVKAVRWATLDDILNLIEHEQFIPYNPHKVALCFHNASKLLFGDVYDDTTRQP